MLKYFPYLIFVLLALFTIQPPHDLDLGWHLRYGEYFFQTGHVLKDNIISFVWPDYKWVEASWEYDLLLYFIFIKFGFLGISLSASIITVIIFYLLVYPVKKFTVWQLTILALTFLVLTEPLWGAGLRAQTPSALFFTIVLLIGYKALKKGTRLILLLPVIFLLWANIHGGFTLGLIILYILFFSHLFLILIEKITHKLKNYTVPKNLKIFGITLIASSITPLLNPWGLKLYQETFNHSSNINLTSIVEWRPLISLPVEGSVAVAACIFVAIVGFFNRRRIDIAYFICLLFMTYLAFSAFRFMLTFGIMVTFFLSQNLPQIDWKKLLPPYLLLATKIIFIIVLVSDLLIVKRFLVFPDSRIINFSWSSYCQILRDCSEEITELMLKNPPIGNGYHFYNYGGYLSWRVPEVKTFIDGRMAAWEQDGKIPPMELGDQVVFSDNPIPFITLDRIYHFQWVILPTQAKVVNYLDSLTKIGIWKKQYTDKYFTYYIKTSNQLSK